MDGQQVENQVQLQDEGEINGEEIIPEDGQEQEIIPQSKPPEVPEDGTYLDALNEAGVD